MNFDVFQLETKRVVVFHRVMLDQFAQSPRKVDSICLDFPRRRRLQDAPVVLAPHLQMLQVHDPLVASSTIIQASPLHESLPQPRSCHSRLRNFPPLLWPKLVDTNTRGCKILVKSPPLWWLWDFMSLPWVRLHAGWVTGDVRDRIGVSRTAQEAEAEAEEERKGGATKGSPMPGPDLAPLPVGCCLVFVSPGVLRGWTQLHCG